MTAIPIARMQGIFALGILVAASAFPTRSADTDTADVHVKLRTKDAIELRCGSALVGTYHIGHDLAKPYLWPLNVPGGGSVTRGWPMEPATPDESSTDHVHQKSLWFCHGDVMPQGIELKKKPCVRAESEQYSAATNSG